jgi:ankyrin repeat protein
MASNEDLEKALKESNVKEALRILSSEGLEKLDLSGLLLSSAEAGRDDLLEQLILLGGDLNEKNSEQLTPLHICAAKNLHRSANVLATSDADLNAQDQKGRTPLAVACITGTEFIGNILLEQGARVDIADEEGRTPLMNAVLNGNAKVANLLIDHLEKEKQSKDLLKTDANGFDALRLAVDTGNVELVKALMDKGGSLETKDKLGRTPVFSAVARGNEAVLNQLIEAKADLNVQDNDGKTPLMVAAAFGNVKLAQSLIQAGAVVDLQDKEGNSAIHYSSGFADPAKEMVTLIKGYGDIQASKGTGAVLVKDNLGTASTGLSPEKIKISGGGSPLPGSDKQVISGGGIPATAENGLIHVKGAPPLAEVTPTGYHQISDLLVKAGANVDAINFKAETPLHRAVQSGYGSVIRGLLENNADPTIEDANGRTPDQYGSGNAEIKKLLTEAQEKLKKKAAAISRNSSGLSSFLVSCAEGKVEDAKRALTDGADINSKDFRGRTGLMLAACNGHGELITFLGRQGANIDMKDAMGTNALSLAILSKQINSVEALIGIGADIHVKMKGVPIILVAVSSSTVNVVECLLAHGADLSAKDYRGAHVAHYARASRVPEMMEFIKSKLGVK